MRVDVKTDSVPVGAWIWLRIDGANGSLALCNLTDPVDQRLKGTSAFTTMSCVMQVPANATNFVFGAGLAGPGTAWFGTATFEEVGTDVPLSPHV
jgi:hypothetical protein